MLDLRWKIYSILNIFFHWKFNNIKKFKVLKRLRCAFATIGKPSMSGISGGEFVIFKTKVGEIFNSECISWLETSLEFKVISQLGSIIKVRFTLGATQHESCIHTWANCTHQTRMYLGSLFICHVETSQFTGLHD